jgi:hypothetical protein
MKQSEHCNRLRISIYLACFLRSFCHDRVSKSVEHQRLFLCRLTNNLHQPVHLIDLDTNLSPDWYARKQEKSL